MRITSVERLKEGDVLGKSLFNERSELLLASGFTLTEEMIGLIRKHGFNYVYLMDEATADVQPEEVINESVRNIVNQKLAMTFKNVKKNLAFEKLAPEHLKKRLEEDSRFKNMLDMQDIRKQVYEVMDEILENHITTFTALPVKSDSGREYQHALDTTVLCLLMGQVFAYSNRELRILGTAAMIHDVGRLAFPGITEKPESERTADEKTIMREHPIYSMLILRGSEPDAFVEHMVVLQHHEQANGTGYPQRLKSSGRPPLRDMKHDARFIHRYAEILSVANVYDNLLSGSFDGRKHTPAEAITRIVNRETGVWNPHVLKSLVRVIQCFPVGATVRILQTGSFKHVGYSGVIIRANPDQQSKPVIVLTHNTLGNEIHPIVADFSKEEDVKLELIL